MKTSLKNRIRGEARPELDHVSTYWSKTLEMNNFSSALERRGFDPIGVGRVVPPEVIAQIVNSHPEHRNDLLSGRIQVQPTDHRAWFYGGDRVTATDYKLIEPQQVTEDPFVIVWEQIPNTTSALVREIMIRELDIDFVKFSTLYGPSSRESMQVIEDLSRLKRRTARELHIQYMDAFVTKWAEVLAQPVKQYHRGTVRTPNRQPAKRKVRVGAVAW